jgi:flagellar motility protein MotE (MotC chaperone)
LIIITAVFGGASYFIVRNNINGLADKNRQTIQKIPLLKNALPKPLDPLDPKFMTADEIKNKYLEYKNSSDEMKKKLEEAEKQLAELKKYKEENEKESQSIEDTKKAQDARQNELDTLKKTIDQLIANADKAGLKQYFETIDPAAAKEVYAEVIKQQQVTENEKKFAQVYEAMDASAAAQIFEQMGNSKLELVSQTVKNMKKESAAAILAAMSPDFASRVSQKLDELYK